MILKSANGLSVRPKGVPERESRTGGRLVSPAKVGINFFEHQSKYL